MQTQKRILSILLTVALAFGLLAIMPIFANATGPITLTLGNPATVELTTLGERREVRFIAPTAGTYSFASAGGGLGANNWDPCAYVLASGISTIDDDGGSSTNYLFAVTLSAGQMFTYYSGSITNPSAAPSYTVTVTAVATPSLTLSRSAWNPGSAASNTSVTVTSGGAWTVSVSNSATSWLTVSPASGTGNGSFTMNATANTGTAARSGVITVTGGLKIVVTQEGAAASLSLSASTWGPPATAANTSVTVTSNVSWTASSDAAAWLTVTPASGSNNGTLTINATANTGTAARTGTITVTGGGVTQTVVVTQAAVPVTNYTVTYNTDGGTPATIAPVTVASGATINLPTTPSKSGNIFKGWKAGSTTLGAGASYTVIGDVTFTAQWAKTIFSTRYEATIWNWIMFIVLFGFIWMWF